MNNCNYVFGPPCCKWGAGKSALSAASICPERVQPKREFWGGEKATSRGIKREDKSILEETTEVRTDANHSPPLEIEPKRTCDRWLLLQTHSLSFPHDWGRGECSDEERGRGRKEECAHGREGGGGVSETEKEGGERNPQTLELFHYVSRALQTAQFLYLILTSSHFFSLLESFGSSVWFVLLPQNLCGDNDQSRWSLHTCVFCVLRWICWRNRTETKCQTSATALDLRHESMAHPRGPTEEWERVFKQCACEQNGKRKREGEMGGEGSARRKRGFGSAAVWATAKRERNRGGAAAAAVKRRGFFFFLKEEKRVWARNAWRYGFLVGFIC